MRHRRHPTRRRPWPTVVADQIVLAMSKARAYHLAMMLRIPNGVILFFHSRSHTVQTGQYRMCGGSTASTVVRSGRQLLAARLPAINGTHASAPRSSECGLGSCNTSRSRSVDGSDHPRLHARLRCYIGDPQLAPVAASQAPLCRPFVAPSSPFRRTAVSCFTTSSQWDGRRLATRFALPLARAAGHRSRRSRLH